MRFHVSFDKFLRMPLLKNTSRRLLLLAYILMLKVCFKIVTSAKNARITKEGLQRSKGNKGKMNKDLLKLPNI